MTKLPTTAVKSIMVGDQPVSRGTIPHDPLKLKVRLYLQIGELLRQLEDDDSPDGEPITIRERTAALTAIGRLQNVLIDKGKDDDDLAGSSVRKYEAAFKNGARRRTKISRSRSGDKLELDRGGDSGWDGEDDPLAGE